VAARACEVVHAAGGDLLAQHEGELVAAGAGARSDPEPELVEGEPGPPVRLVSDARLSLHAGELLGNDA
jgi:hypothetical protein